MPFHRSLLRAGFTTADHTWLPVSDEYKTNNALQQLRAPQSHLQIFKTLVRVRQEPSFKNGTLNIQAIGDNIIVYSRSVGTGFCAKFANLIIFLDLAGKSKAAIFM